MFLNSHNPHNHSIGVHLHGFRRLSPAAAQESSALLQPMSSAPVQLGTDSQTPILNDSMWTVGARRLDLITDALSRFLLLLVGLASLAGKGRVRPSRG